MHADMPSYDNNDSLIPEAATIEEAKQVKLELFNRVPSITHIDEDYVVVSKVLPEDIGPKSDFVPDQVIKYLNSKRFDNDRRHAFSKQRYQGTLVHEE